MAATAQRAMLPITTTLLSTATFPTMATATAARTATTGQNRLDQWGRRSRTTSSASFSNLVGNGTPAGYLGARLRWRFAMRALPVHLAGEDGVRRHDPVEEQQAVEVVQLVQEGPGLEGIHLQHPVVSFRGEAPDHEGGGTRNIARQIGNAHAPLPGHDRSVRQQHLGVEEHDLSVAGAGLAMVGDVDHEGPETHSDLR